MRAFRKILTVAAAVSVLVTAAASAAVADPVSTPSLNTVVGVNCPPLFVNGYVPDYDATKPTYPVACWNPVNPATGVSSDGIITKALNSTDTSCELLRPDGSDSAIAALNENQKDANNDPNGQKPYCVDFAISTRPPDSTGSQDAFVALTRDGIA